jgi:hypothetical protein
MSGVSNFNNICETLYRILGQVFVYDLTQTKLYYARILLYIGTVL